MHWQFGIDEAGYGPNLGPLVQACVGFLLPEDDPSGWKTFAKIARRVGEPADDRLVIDDSKKVYSSGGFAALERTVMSRTPLIFFQPTSLHRETHGGYAADCEDSIDDEAWYRGDENLPIEIGREECQRLYRELWSTIEPYRECAFTSKVCITATPRFNDIVCRHGTKSAVVLDRIKSLMKACWEQLDYPAAKREPFDEPVRFLCDKLGGRHFYGPFLQEVFPEGWPVAEVESPGESRYRILNLKRDVTVSFMPRADAASLPVALASMVAKYLREVCMKQFNTFWQSHCPGLAPTAGYPVDARRFYAEIGPAMRKLGLHPDKVWRKK